MTSKMSRRQFTKTSGLATMGILLGCSTSNRFSLIIRNGTIIDGLGSPPLRADIGIKGDRIVAIADLSTATADKIVDASGLYVSPGFIDIHTHTDTELLVNPKGESKMHQGVTTEVAGNCGSSPFPMTDEEFTHYDENLFEKYDIHATWKRISGFLNALEKSRISMNYATFTGHGDLRAHVVGKNDETPTPDQMREMKRLLRDSMENGSFGLSTGLEYAPSSYASTEEIIDLCTVVSENGGVYATHMRNEDDHVEEAIVEALQICEQANVSTQISHLKACNQANWHKVDHMLELIETAESSGLPVTADRYPYIAYGTGLSTFLPLWSRQGSTEEILNRLQDSAQVSKIREYAEYRGARIGGWDRVVISFCKSEENKKWEGKSIMECASNTGDAPFEFIRKILIEEENGVSIVGFAMDEDNLKKVLSSPLSMVASDGCAVAPYGKLARGKPHPRYYGTFPRVLGRYCREEKIMDIQTAVAKMTSMPARKLGLKQRGVIETTAFADIVVFDGTTVSDRATFTDPHQYAAGIKHVIVNGAMTIENEEHTGAVSGTVLRHGSA
ncbi:MAG: D-aminoacylase [candidate division KSB1 bacterium]|jgi:N-acyl-D-amino-acid deacylase|nr:D-aminoacylase [candidate division KSB1 bacterium]